MLSQSLRECGEKDVNDQLSRLLVSNQKEPLKMVDFTIRAILI